MLFSTNDVISSVLYDTCRWEQYIIEISKFLIMAGKFPRPLGRPLSGPKDPNTPPLGAEKFILLFCLKPGTLIHLNRLEIIC